MPRHAGRGAGLRRAIAADRACRASRLRMPLFYAWQKFPLKSRRSPDVERIANNLVHRTCAKAGEAAADSKTRAKYAHPMAGTCRQAAICLVLRNIVAPPEIHLESKALRSIKVIAHNVIHKKCAKARHRQERAEA